MCEPIPKGECIYCEGKQIIHVDHTNVGVNVCVNLSVNRWIMNLRVDAGANECRLNITWCRFKRFARLGDPQ